MTENNVDGSELKERKPAEIVAELLGVDLNDLIFSLCSSKVLIFNKIFLNERIKLLLMQVTARGEIICKTNNVSEAHNAKDVLAKGLYSRLFDYVVSCINKLLSFSRMV